MTQQQLRNVMQKWGTYVCLEKNPRLIVQTFSSIWRKFAHLWGDRPRARPMDAMHTEAHLAYARSELLVSKDILSGLSEFNALANSVTWRRYFDSGSRPLMKKFGAVRLLCGISLEFRHTQGWTQMCVIVNSWAPTNLEYTNSNWCTGSVIASLRNYAFEVKMWNTGDSARGPISRPSLILGRNHPHLFEGCQEHAVIKWASKCKHLFKLFATIHEREISQMQLFNSDVGARNEWLKKSPSSVDNLHCPNCKEPQVGLFSREIGKDAQYLHEIVKI